MLELLAILIAVINIVAFVAIGLDKKKSVEHSGRVKEVSLFLWAIFFGSAGVLLGMLFFHHKTRKLKFIFGVTLLLIQQILLLYLLLTYFLK